MKTEIRENLGFDVEIRNFPTTLAEAVELAGSEQAVLDGFVNYQIYHVHNSRLRAKIVEFLGKQFDMSPRTEEKDGKVKVIEKDTQFIARVRDEQGDDAVNALADQIRTIMPEADWTPGSRGGGGKLGAQWFGKVDELIEDGKFDAFCEKHGIDQSQEEEVVRAQAASKVKQLITAHMEAQRKAAEAALV